MNSKSSLPAILSRLQQAQADPHREPRLSFVDAAAEIGLALNIKFEPAMMTLYGLCATGTVRCLNGQGEIIEEDEYTIANFSVKPAYVITDDVRSWLRDHSLDPQPQAREAVILKLFKEDWNPPRKGSWKEFCGLVRDRCNGWRAKGKPSLGFGDKQIQRIVKELRAK
jgi:hypothetical protein